MKMELKEDTSRIVRILALVLSSQNGPALFLYKASMGIATKARIADALDRMPPAWKVVVHWDLDNLGRQSPWALRKALSAIWHQMLVKPLEAEGLCLGFISATTHQHDDQVPLMTLVERMKLELDGLGNRTAAPLGFIVRPEDCQPAPEVI